MRFRTRQRPRGLLRPSDQRRLALLVGCVGLVLLSFTVVRRPAFWRTLFPDPVADQQPATDSDSVAPAAFEMSGESLQYDEFLTNSGADVADGGGLKAKAATEAEDTTVTARRIPYSAAGDSSEASGAAGSIPKVPADLLKAVRDDVIGIHSAESEAYFAAMKLAAKVEQRKNLKAPQGSFALFMDSPNGSRGIAWELRGRLRRLSEVKGATNAFGVRLLYDAWLTTPDSGDQLVHVVAMSADKSLTKAIGSTNRERSVDFTGPDPPEVRFTGYFFKREGYASSNEQGVSLAPLFVAGTLHEIPEPAVTVTRAEELTPYLGWLTVLVCLGVAVMVWSFTRSDAAHAQTRAHQLTRLPAHASFENVSAMSVGEALGQLDGDMASVDAYSSK
ncbi:MAG: hypothetical protein RIK87_26440 [Fuerstiella sp.]